METGLCSDFGYFVSSAACSVGLAAVEQPVLVVEVAEGVVVATAVEEQSWVGFAELVAVFAELAVTSSVAVTVDEMPFASVVVPFVVGPSVAALDPAVVVLSVVHAASVAFAAAAFVFEAYVVVVESAQAVVVVVVAAAVASSVIAVVALQAAAAQPLLPCAVVAADAEHADDPIVATVAVAEVLVCLQLV